MRLGRSVGAEPTSMRKPVGVLERTSAWKGRFPELSFMPAMFSCAERRAMSDELVLIPVN